MPSPRSSHDPCPGQTLSVVRPTVVEQCEMTEIEMTEIGRVVCNVPIKSLFLIIVNSRRFGSCSRSALSTDKDFGQAENWKSLVRLLSYCI